jgi:hypothetical protein
MTERQRLLALHVEAVRVRDASLRALGMAIRIPGNGLAQSFKRTWQAASEAEDAVYRRILQDRCPIIPIRGPRGKR